MKSFFLMLCLFLLLYLFGWLSPSNQLDSPDKTISLQIHDDNGEISYSISKNNKAIIDQSILGIKTSP